MRRRISRYFDAEALLLTAFTMPMMLVPYVAWSHGVPVILALLVYSLIVVSLHAERLEKRLSEAEDRLRGLEGREAEHA